MQRSTWLARMPWEIIALAVALMGLGWLAIARGLEVAGVSRSFLARQMIWSLLALVALVVATRPNYRVLARWSYAAFFASLLLLAAVYAFAPVNGARRWIRFGAIGLQPSEFAKLAFVLGLARYLMVRESYRRLGGLLAPLVLMMVPLLLVLKEPDLGTALVFLPVLFAMLLAAGARMQHLALVALAAVALSPIVWSQMSREQKSRITALAEQTSVIDKPTDDDFHLHQAKQVLALGGWSGSLVGGEATANRRLYFVPESHTDSIAVIVGERFGLVGLGAMLLMFALLVWRILCVAGATREPFGRLVCVGVASLIASQVLINTGMLVGLLPITGLALPLVSYGGSSLLANGLALGLVANVALRPGYEMTNEPFRYVR